MYECETWTIKKAECWRTDALVLWCWRRFLRVPWTARDPTSPSKRKSVLSVHSKDWTPILWPSDVKSWLIGKYPDAGKDLRQEEKGTTEDEMIGWHHWLNGHEFEKTRGDMKDRKAWCVAVHGVTKNWMWFSNWTTSSSSYLHVSVGQQNFRQSACIYPERR